MLRTSLKIFLLVALAMTCVPATTMAQSLPGIDPSPADISYLRLGRNGDVISRVVYSRPQMKERTVFGGLVPFDKVWRTGANEATEISFYRDVTFNGTTVPAGDYSLFTIPGETEWTVIINSVRHQWGAFSYAQESDVLRTTVSPSMADESVEAFTIAFQTKPDGASMILAWDKTRVEVPITYE